MKYKKKEEERGESMSTTDRPQPKTRTNKWQPGERDEPKADEKDERKEEEERKKRGTQNTHENELFLLRVNVSHTYGHTLTHTPAPAPAPPYGLRPFSDEEHTGSEGRRTETGNTYTRTDMNSSRPGNGDF